MEYCTEREEQVFEPDFGYGYLPEEDRPAKPEKKRRPVKVVPSTEAPEEEAEIHTLLRRVPAPPLCSLIVTLLIMALLLLGALFASSGTVGHVSACAPLTGVRFPL